MDSPRMTGAEGLLDRARFEEFYGRVLPVVYGYLWRRCGRREDVAMELTQETFLGAVRALRSGVVPEMPLAWLMSVARRRLIDHYRRSGVRQGIPPLVERWEVAPSETSQMEARLVSALASVPNHYRLVLVLRYVDDLRVSEVAGLLNKSQAATESLLARARAALAEAYEEQSDE